MYARPNNMYKAYQQNDILTLPPAAIIERLYQAMERSLMTAKDAMEKGQTAIKGEKLGHALTIIGELQASLDMEKGGEIAENLYVLYSFATNRLLMANVKNDVHLIDEVINTMKPLGQAWSEIRREQNGHNGSTTDNGAEASHTRNEPIQAAAGY